MLALIAVPVVHWFTALPAPFIGGYVAGTRTGATSSRAFLLGGFMGLMVLIPAVGILSLFSLMFLDLTTGWIVVLSGGYGVVVVALATLGAAVGGASARRHVST